jgi:hypothetical protein
MQQMLEMRWFFRDNRGSTCELMIAGVRTAFGFAAGDSIFVAGLSEAGLSGVFRGSRGHRPQLQNRPQRGRLQQTF